MSVRIKLACALLGAIIFAIAVVNSAIAGSFEEGMAAYERGDYASALRLLRPLAEQGSADAQEQLGLMYQWGYGVPRDSAEAAKWYAEAMKRYRKAAEQGDPYAQYKLGTMYDYGRGVPENYAEAMRWFRKSAEQGNADAQDQLGLMYALGQGVPQDKAEAAKWYAGAAKGYREAANQGSAHVAYKLGKLYEYGLPQNYAEAVKWYRKAAEQGSTAAMTTLGAMYHSGRGVPRNYTEAARWYRKAAEQGDIRDMHTLGVMYYSGRGVPQDFAEAVKWYRKSADGGWEYAQFDLGLMYYNGQGVAKNYAEAMRWLRKAADQGYTDAQNHLGIMYELGQGVPRNYTEAARWYRKAAEKGNANAQFNLGVTYYNGRGVPQDYVQAHVWFNLATSRYEAVQKEGRDQALKNRDSVAAKMTPAQIAEAQRLAHVCVKDDFDYGECSFDRSQVARRDDEMRPSPAPQNKVTSTGTGFFATDSGHIVTNAHVVKDCLAVRSSRGGQITKVSIDEQSDLALYIASEKPKAFARLRGGQGARVGEPVVAVGFPLSGLLSSDPIVTTGIVSALSGLGNDRRAIQTTAPVQVGNSGGPLLGENGSVVGVVVGKLDAMKIAEVIGDVPQNVNFAVSLGTLQSFLSANGVSYLLDDSNVTKSPADIAAEASRYTVLIECVR